MSFHNYPYMQQASGLPATQYSATAPFIPAMGYPSQAPEERPTTYPGQYAQIPSATAGQGQHRNTSPAIDPTIASWFHAVDQDNSGHVNASELRLALQNGNWSQFSEEACHLMIAMFDKNHTGTIDLHEFGQLFSFVNKWIDTYRHFDQDNSGTISESEMTNALQQMGYRLSPQFVSFLVSKYSTKKKDITLDNFILINIKIQTLTDAFRVHDLEMKGIITVSYEEFLKMTLSSV
ncbi:peflin-like [Macrobrachium nipponense]|uniref:peflin-like n=1 Tax=Macrobrachium nipponense TaxID=159736 RepID=UPI0030C89D76